MHTNTEIVAAELAVEASVKPQGVQVTGTAEAARRYLDAAAKFGRASSVMAVMAGFEIGALKKLGGWVQGGRRGKTQDDLGFAHCKTWEEFCSKELRISDETARIYLQLADQARPKLRHLGSLDALINDLLATPVSQLPLAQYDLLTNAVNKITDGKTQLELFRDWGLAKKAPVPATGGALGGAGAPRHQPTEEEIREAARRSWTDIMASVLREKDSFTALDDAHQEALQLHLEALLNGLKWWKALRPSQRGPATRRELLDLLKVTVA